MNIGKAKMGKFNCNNFVPYVYIKDYQCDEQVVIYLIE